MLRGRYRCSAKESINPLAGLTIPIKPGILLPGLSLPRGSANVGRTLPVTAGSLKSLALSAHVNLCADQREVNFRHQLFHRNLPLPWWPTDSLWVNTEFIADLISHIIEPTFQPPTGPRHLGPL